MLRFSIFKIPFCLFGSFLFFFVLTAEIKPDEPIIRSLKAYPNNGQSQLPVLVFDEKRNSDHLTIEFDIDSDYQPNFHIVFRFCDRNWKPYENLFLANSGENIDYNIMLSFLPSTLKEARYHFRGSYPDSKGNVTFPFSGKWRYYITDSNDTSMVYAEGKFIVVRDAFRLPSGLKSGTLENKIYFPSDLARIFSITADFRLPESYFPGYVQGLEIIENHKLDYPYFVGRDVNTDVRFYYWDANRRFTFTARDVRPGNEYRVTDLRNINIHQSGTVKAQFDGLETSRFFTEGRDDHEGGSILLNYRDENAVYLNVEFSLRAPDELSNKAVFLAGSFTDWKVLPEFRMNNNDGLYTITIPLKRGVYDYQYVTADMISGRPSNIDWFVLEGNSLNTSNNYYLFLYYSEQEKGGYDRIIGYQQIISE